jgi:hypothetical protein
MQDINIIPDPFSTRKLSNSKTLTANNTTANVALFSITGVVRVLKLYGIVTTAIGSNHTGAYFNLYDQSARVNITLNTVGVTLSSFTAGAMVMKTALAATLATIQNNNVGAIVEPTAAQGVVQSEFIAVKKTAAVTEIDYTYTTTNTPTTGAIQFFIEYQPLSADGAVAAL